MFLRSAETGLRDDNILTKFRQVLHVKHISDEDLIQQMGNISSAEAERQARIGKRVKDVQASSVVSDEKQTESMQKKKKVEKSSESRILETMEAMRAQIQSLQEEMKSHKSETVSKATPGYYEGRTDYYRWKQNNPARNGQEPFRACSGCNEKGLSQSCNHCYYFGGENHFARDCLKHQRDQGSGRGLRRGDKA